MFILLAVICFLLAFIVYVRHRWTTRATRLPPGPSSISTFLRMMDKSFDLLKTIKELRTQYGNIVKMDVGCSRMVVICGLENIKKVFVDHTDVTCHRPDDFLCGTVFKGSGILSSNGTLWEQHKRFALSALGKAGMNNTAIEPRICHEIDQMLACLEASGGEPVDVSGPIQAALTNITLGVTIGKRYAYDDMDFLQLMELVENSTRLSAFAGICNSFPFLNYLPGDMFKLQQLMKNEERQYEFFRKVLKHKDFLESTDGSYAASYMREMDRTDERTKTNTFTDFQLCRSLCDLILGGREGPSTILRWAYLILLRHPDVHRRMQNEIDSVVGSSRRHPTYSERDSLPYCMATITEICRYGDNPAISSIHSNSIDLHINSYTIPKGSTLLMNLSSITQDPLLFPDPGSFVPERFLDSDGDLTGTENIQLFGYGKRKCIAENMGKMELFLFITAVVHTFDLQPEVKGETPEMDCQFDVSNVPKPYKVRFLKRNA